MVDGPPRKLQRKQREPTREGMEETFAFLLLKVAGQTCRSNLCKGLHMFLEKKTRKKTILDKQV